MGLGLTSGSWDEALLSTALGAVLFWLLGAAVGLCLPRPKWMAAGSPFSFAAFNSPAGILLRRFSLAYQGAYIIREIWYYFTCPGTFHALLTALAGLFSGQGWSFVPPQRPNKLRKLRHKKSSERRTEKAAVPEWYITDVDLHFFKDRVEGEGEVKGAGPWEHMVTKDFGNFTYEAHRRWLPGGKTEYKSVTVAEDSTGIEFMDFYLDDHTRPKWDAMISEHEIVENGDGAERCQVVRWERTFPFSFLSKREYIIGRRMFRGPDGCLYGITKNVEHPRAPRERDIVRMDEFWSMWRSRTIPCPHGTGRPACETVLLHHEQFKIPENLARFAVRHGMTTFVKKMGPAVREFVAERRQRISPFEDDPDAYGVRGLPNPPSRTASVASTMSDLSFDDSAAAASEPSSATVSATASPSCAAAADARWRLERAGSGRGEERRRRGSLSKLARINGAVIAAGVAFALGRSTGQGRLG